jgi:hypothetical protein
MQGAGAGAGRWAAGGTRVVRLLVAVCLLGTALLIMALVGQGAAAARGPTATAGAAGGGRSVAGSAGVALAGATTPPVRPGTGKGVHAELAWPWSRPAGVLELSEGPPPDAGAWVAGGAGSPEDPGRSGGPGTGSAAIVPDWRGWSPRAPRVAAADVVVDDGGGGDGRSPGDGTSPGWSSTAKLLPSGGVRRGQLQEGPRYDPTQVRDAVYKLNDDALDLRDRIRMLAGDRADPKTGRTLSELVESVRSDAAAVAKLELPAGTRVADASQPALDRLNVFIASTRQVIRLATDTAVSVQEGSKRIQGTAEAAAQTAAPESGAFIKRLAAATDAAPVPGVVDEGSSEPTTVGVIVDEVAQQARSLAQVTSETKREIAPVSPYLTRVRDLAMIVGVHAEAAKRFAKDSQPVPARDGTIATINALRNFSNIVNVEAGELGGAGAKLRAAADAAARFADAVEAEIPKSGGTQPAAPSEEAPDKGTGVEPPPSPDDTGSRHAGGGTGEGGPVAGAVPPAAEVAGGGDVPSSASPLDNPASLLMSELGDDTVGSLASERGASVDASGSGSPDGDPGAPTFGDDPLADLDDSTFASFADVG